MHLLNDLQRQIADAVQAMQSSLDSIVSSVTTSQQALSALQEAHGDLDEKASRTRSSVDDIAIRCAKFEQTLTAHENLHGSHNSAILQLRELGTTIIAELALAQLSSSRHHVNRIMND
jgi:hypothetical protein